MFKKLLTVLLTFVMGICLFPTSIIAEEKINLEPKNKEGYAIVTYDQLEYELGENSPYLGYYITYGINEEGNLIRMDIHDSTYTMHGSNKTVEMFVKIFIGNYVVGTLISKVIDGVVVSVTGKTGEEWVSYAIKGLVGGKPRDTFILDKNTVCIAYPPYGDKPYYCR